MEALSAYEEKATAGYGRYSVAHAHTAAAHKSGYAGSKKLITEMVRLRAACYIVIDMFSGIRDSEMMSIGENCIAHRRSRDDSCDVTWLHGTLYKTGQRAKAWQVPPVVEEAVDVLSRLSAPLRTALQQEEREIDARIGSAIAKEKARLVKRLDTVRRQKDKLFLARSINTLGGSISVLSGIAMSAELKRFCANHDILGEDGQPYPLHSHQFRRTYARFVARAELGDLLTLRDHFGHWSLDMTVYYTDGGADEYEADTELLQMVTREKQARQTDIIEGYLDSDTPLANGGDWIKSWRSTVRTSPNKEELIAQYAGSITLNGTGHSWCVGSAKGTGCGGLCVFEAKMCVDCNYGIIGPEHRPAWEGIRDQQKEALALDDMGIAGKARAQQILDYAEKVLRRLGGQGDA
jgi:integrase